MSAEAVMGSAGTERRPWLQKVGIYPPLAWGFLGVLLFMIGDGVETGFLAPYLKSAGFNPPSVALIFTVYGFTAAIAAWCSGALSDIWGPRRVMMLGFGIWVVFEILFLALAIPANIYWLLLLSYGLRGFGYPLFAFGFLVWVATSTPPKMLGSGVGWFWFAFTGGLPTIGSLVASGLIPFIGSYYTFWTSLGIIIVGGLIALLLVRDPAGFTALAPPGQRPLRTLLRSVTLAFENPKIGVGMLVRVINTAPEFGFFVFLPGFFTDTIGFSLPQWLRLLSVIFAVNIVFNLIFGIVGDKVGWRQTVAYFGGFGSAISTLALYYVPNAAGANYPLALLVGAFYGATLAGYVPLSALMPSLEPENKGAAMAMLNLGAGAAAFTGPAIVGLFLGPLGVAGVMWIFAGLYVASGIMALFLKIPRNVEELEKIRRQQRGGGLGFQMGGSLLGHPPALRYAAGEDDIDLILFDIGGTIYDDNAFAQALLKAAQELSEEEIDEREFWEIYDRQREGSDGGGLRTAVARRFVPGDDRERLSELAKQYWEYPESALYPDVKPTLEALAEHYQLGIVANTRENVLEAMERDGINDLFNVLALADVAGVEKPDPQIFRYALDEAGVQPGNAIHVGNRLDTDVRPAQQVGMRTVWMLRGEAPPAPTADQLDVPDAVITSLIGLPAVLARLGRQRTTAAAQAR